MSARVHLVALLGCTLLSTVAVAQDAGAPEPGIAVPVEVRVERTLVDPGQPLANAWVAFVEPGQGPSEAAPVAVATDSAGRVLAQGPPGGGTLLVWADGRAPVALHVDGPLAGPVVLDRSRDLAVRVRASDGDPAGDVRVEVEVALPVAGAPLGASAEHRYTLETRTDAAGAAALSGLPTVNLRVSASASDAVAEERFPVRAGGDPVVLTLSPGARLSGRAVVIPGGGPAVGAVLRAGGRETVVAEDGSWELTAVPPGEVEVRVGGGELLLRAPPRLVVADGERRPGIDLELLRASVLTGLVVDAAGEPVESAEGTLLWPASEASWSGLRRELLTLVTPEGDGRFRVEGLPPAEGVALEVRSPGHAPTLVEGISLAAGARTGPLRVEMARGALLAGRVVGEDAVAAGAVRVEARSVGDAAMRTPADVTTSGPDGTFVLEGLPAMPVMLRLVPAPGGSGRVAEHGPYTPGAETPRDVGALVLRSGHTLAARVAGAPPRALAVVVDAAGTVREALVEDGGFSVAGLAPGDAFVEVESPEAPGGARAVVRLPAGWPLALKWEAAAPVTLRLRGPTGGPVTVADLLFTPRPRANAEDAVSPPPVSLRAGDVDGVVTVPLEPGPWQAVVRSGPLVGTAAIDVAPGSGAVVNVILRRGETVRGRVSSALGDTGVEGARVTVEDFGGSGQPSVTTRTDARGAFSIDGVRPGIFRVTVEADGHAPWRSPPLAVRPSAVTDVGVVDLYPGGAVAGLVLDASGAPLRGAEVRAEHEDGTLRTSTTDLHGRFRVEHLPAGDVTLAVGDVRQRVLLPLGARDVRVRIELGAGVVLRGRVTSDGRPEPFAVVVATAGDEDLSGGQREVSTHTDGRGEFRLPPLPPGDVWLEVLAAGAEIPESIPLRLAAAAEEWVEVRLPSGGVIGSVRSATGAVVSGAAVWLWALDAEGLPVEVVARSVSSPDGGYEIGRVGAGRYEVEARRAGHGEGRSESIEVRSGTLAFGVVVDLTDEAVLAAELLDERGLAVPGAWLSAVPYGSDPARVRLRAQASADGRARLRSLAPGAYEVAAGGPGRGRVELGVVRVLAGTTDLGRVHLDPGGALRIVALHPGFFPAARVRVRVEDMLGRDPRPRQEELAAGRGRGGTAVDGSLLVPDLAPGWYRVGLAGRPPEDAYLVEVRAGDVARVSLWAPWPE